MKTGPVLATLLACLFVQVSFTEEVIDRSSRRGRKHDRAGGRKGSKHRGCSKWVFGECIAYESSCGPGKKLGNREGTCRVLQKTFDCNVACDTLEDDPAVDIYVDDNVDTTDRKPKRSRKPKRARKQKRGKQCRYKKGPWGECDVTTNKKTRTLTLRKGGDECEPTKTISRKCQKGKNGNPKNRVKGCKYRRSRSNKWSKCDPTTNTKTVTKELKKGDPNKCNATKVVSKQCGPRPNKLCKYEHGDWSECNTNNNTRTQVLTLKQGDSSQCEQTKTVNRKCKKACRYQKGSWGECDGEGKRVRMDHLRPGSEKTCDPTRTSQKDCKNTKKKCIYDFGSWSECVNDKRVRTKTLTSSDTSCKSTVEVTKPCYFKNGEERCFYGAWGDFSDCRNGVRRKIRPVQFGGERCERRAVKTKPCGQR